MNLPKYKLWLGILIWVIGSTTGVILALCGFITREDSTLLVWVFFAIPILWSLVTSTNCKKLYTKCKAIYRDYVVICNNETKSYFYEQCPFPNKEIHFATTEEREAFFDEYYKLELADGWWVRAYYDEDMFIRICYTDGNKKDWHYIRNEPYYKAVCKKLGLKIMPYKQSKGDYKYPKVRKIKDES